MSEKLLPCPFCGGEVRIEDIMNAKHENDSIWMIECDKCGASSTFSVADKEGGFRQATENEAVYAWNRRSEK